METTCGDAETQESIRRDAQETSERERERERERETRKPRHASDTLETQDSPMGVRCRWRNFSSQRQRFSTFKKREGGWVGVGEGGWIPFSYLMGPYGSLITIL